LKRVVLVPRAPLDLTAVHAWLEGRDDTTRLDQDSFLIELSSADIATQAEVFIAADQIAIELETIGTTYGSPLVTELRKVCEELATRFGLVMAGGKSVGAFFDDGGP
jgi:hypothetical protein